MMNSKDGMHQVLLISPNFMIFLALVLILDLNLFLVSFDLVVDGVVGGDSGVAGGDSGVAGSDRWCS